MGYARHVDAEGSITKRLLIQHIQGRSSIQPLLPYHDSILFLAFSSAFWSHVVAAAGSDDKSQRWHRQGASSDGASLIEPRRLMPPPP
mmetsp:Transcript_19369/g.28905  ORF Transcript_19369/g.28905 Transcript_19369/m.28905 type:complete len:88 (+) Transcript_19369:343-606(+)